MRYIRYAVWGVLAVVFVSVSLANRGLVSLKLMPEALAELVGFNPSITLPLFVVVLGGWPLASRLVTCLSTCASTNTAVMRASNMAKSKSSRVK